MTRKSAAIFAVLALALAPAAFAGKGANGGKPSGGSSSLSLVVLYSPAGDGQAHYNGQVTFNVSTTATDKPLVVLNCYQGNPPTWVYSHSAGFYPGYPWPSAQTFTLSSGAWTGGAADCTAELYMSNGRGGFKTLKTLDVHVDA